MKKYYKYYLLFLINAAALLYLRAIQLEYFNKSPDMSLLDFLVNLAVTILFLTAMSIAVICYRLGQIELDKLVRRYNENK